MVGRIDPLRTLRTTTRALAGISLGIAMGTPLPSVCSILVGETRFCGIESAKKGVCMDGDGDLSAFLAYLRANRGLSGNTVKAYGTDVRECLHALASRGIADLRQVTTDDLRGWMAFETRDHARSSMARKVVSVRSFFAWAHEHGRIEADPAAVLMTPKLPDTLPSVLTEAQAERLMDRVDDDASLHAASSQRYETRHDEMPRLDSAHRGEGMSQRDEVVALRDAAMLELLYATGIRVAELVGLDIGDVDWLRIAP